MSGIKINKTYSGDGAITDALPEIIFFRLPYLEINLGHIHGKIRDKILSLPGLRSVDSLTLSWPTILAMILSFGGLGVQEGLLINCIHSVIESMLMK